MEEVIHYLELKNQYYDKFHSITRKFYEQAEQGLWEDLDFFVDNRERILNIIRSFDFKIAKLFDELDMGQLDLEVYRPRVKHLLDRRVEIANQIVALDLQLISKMDDIKSDTIRDLKKSITAQAKVDAFVETGPQSIKTDKTV